MTAVFFEKYRRRVELPSPIMAPIDLLMMDNDQEREFANRVNKWHGLVRIFVHPFFTKYKERLGYDYYPKTDWRVALGLSRLLRLDEGKTPPVIVFEEADFLDSMMNNIKRLGTVVQNVYSVATDQDSSVPIVADGFVCLSNVLKSLGVTRVLIGGIYLYITDNCYINKDNRTSSNHPLLNQRLVLSGGVSISRRDFSFNGCAGYTAKELASFGFDVGFSNFSSPQNVVDLNSALRGKEIVARWPHRTRISQIR